MDIVYLVKNCYDNEELTYSLRSLSNLPHDKVFMVGGCPSNLNKQNIVHIAVAQGPDKFANTRHNIGLICENPSLSDDFILMNDDFFILKPIKDVNEELNLCRGKIEDVEKAYKMRYNGGSNDYLIGMHQTRVYLQDRGFLDPLSYELHTPMVMNKQKVLEMFTMPYLDSIKVLHWRSLYGNKYLKGSKVIEDVKLIYDYFYPLGSDKFVSSEDNTWPRVKTYVGKLFPEKSIYEI